VCGEVSHAAVLCPSFYKAQVVSNPNRWDLFCERVRHGLIGWLQRAEAKRRAVYAF
jgi:indolepyruvate ferredoxin oxidoreductase alpha subunit